MDFPHITLPVSLVVMLVATCVFLMVFLGDTEDVPLNLPPIVVVLAFFASLMVAVVAAGFLLWEIISTNTFFPGVPALIFALLCIFVGFRWGK
ncbi:hypothetical protein A3C89_03725 [Candidatus Kaiserbacteria bacterium RIFCSPHIGHO2_02_FULL_50_50]|uniref:Uncharacterized protein n=1 Tax=Candidatus Kaiserbacteria bacterium RIFCSPHIGHO2_02_FULL_50_50 TaxID=1798492 RepID=A0A1F6DBZ8_9BACT|nr:MAG: hypothetical protein A3C89_03725 [Candidatus Kaiserbacteria bacterium RIFCSPHIGHO2_02_FULL_50_50]OGG88054.1 MAG: hypothetical protein A3G62_01805 [Candidatus Kaiserbacteria bacterium RIFCSPLOWO2_12_FULL_50_10]